MNQARNWVAMAVVTMVAALAVGCSSPEDKQHISALQAQLEEVQAERDSYLAQLNDCMGLTDAQRARIAALEAQLAEGRTAPGTQQRGDWTEMPGLAFVDVGSDVLFDSGKIDIKPAGKQALSEIAQAVRSRYGDREIWVIGHTDNEPIKHSPWKTNLNLSLQRAAAVFKELQEQGVQPTRMVAAGRGEYKPRASNANNEGRQMNRRVQIIAVERPETDRAPAQ